jgi:hypothetical protein
VSVDHHASLPLSDENLPRWHTHPGTNGVKPVTCLAKNTVGT